MLSGDIRDKKYKIIHNERYNNAKDSISKIEETLSSLDSLNISADEKEQQRKNMTSYLNILKAGVAEYEREYPDVE